MEDEITIGRCKNCKWNEGGSCMNNGKIHEIGSGFKEDQTSVASYGEFNPDAVKLMDRVGWE